MNEIILSIKPVYTRLIFEGIKKVEYRKWIPSCNIPFRVYVYSSHPVKKIVGEFIVKSILKGTPQKIWDNTSEFGGIEKSEFFKYFTAELAYAYNISDILIYREPKVLTDFGLRRAPQRFCYKR